MKNKVLKKCPFCSDSTVKVIHNTDTSNKYAIYCGTCGSHSYEFTSKSKAIKFWNSRSIKRFAGHCPLCNEKARITNEYRGKLFSYICTSCSFSSGLYKCKEKLKDLWLKNN